MSVAAALQSRDRQLSAGTRGGERIVLPGQSPEGEYILGVLLKRTYRHRPGRRVHAR